MSSSKASLKLMVHKTSRKILFGQADKKFIDFLFTFLALPIATIFNLLSTESSTNGPLRNLYHSFKNLDVTDFQQKYHNSMNFLLKPKVQISRCHVSSISNLLPIESSLPQKFYKCSTSTCHDYYASNSIAMCPGCNRRMNNTMQYVAVSDNDVLMKELMEERFEENVGYVKDKFSYLVMEDLTVKPMSTISAFSMLSEFGVDNASLIEEKVVYLDHKLGLDLVKASMCCSSTVLTDVFLHNIEFEEQKEEGKVKIFNLQL